MIHSRANTRMFGSIWYFNVVLYVIRLYSRPAARPLDDKCLYLHSFWYSRSANKRPAAPAARNCWLFYLERNKCTNLFIREWVWCAEHAFLVSRPRHCGNAYRFSSASCMKMVSYWHFLPFESLSARSAAELNGGNGSNIIIVCVSNWASLMFLPNIRTVKPGKWSRGIRRGANKPKAAERGEWCTWFFARLVRGGH